ncbi:hypothetical protein BVRB_1g020640 [Beta vulgaris subsp. vulgaris]|uniref:Uncharacterized protein n=1 Tax=Beta vulgaris subsp. vulgaris TaxID=3555 RepID=A0A0J8E9J6_BETVV|nr:hypothetical protein BVRB_1g020640 [Beta vulgaris subsp. vulgaris]
MAQRLRRELQDGSITGVPPPPSDPVNPRRKKERSTTSSGRPETVIALERPHIDEGNYELPSTHTYTPSSPSPPPKRVRGALAGGDAPFTRLSIDDKGRRLRKVCREMAGPKDEEYLESIGEVEVDELHHAWLDMSIRMTMVARRRITLTAENERLSARVAELEVAARGPQAIVKDLETKLHKSECELTRAMRAIDNDQADFQEKSKELNGQIGQLTRDCDRALKKVSRLSARLEEARREAERSSAEWFNAWQESDECLAYNTEVGGNSFQAGEEAALARMKKVVTQDYPDFDWEASTRTYQSLCEAEMVLLRDQMATTSLGQQAEPDAPQFSRGFEDVAFDEGREYDSSSH